MWGVAGQSRLEELEAPKRGVGGGVCGQDRRILYGGSVKKRKMKGKENTYLEHRTCFVQREGDKP